MTNASLSSRAKPRDLTKAVHYVYIATNRSETLYVGSTNNLKRRMYEHRMGFKAGFTKQYKVDALLFYEKVLGIKAARSREAQIKKWNRVKKIKLIESINPSWIDLSTTLEATTGGRRA